MYSCDDTMYDCSCASELALMDIGKNRTLPINKLLDKMRTPCTIDVVYCILDGLVQDCSNSSALAMELMQSCTKLSKWP